MNQRAKPPSRRDLNETGLARCYLALSQHIVGGHAGTPRFTSCPGYRAWAIGTRAKAARTLRARLRNLNRRLAAGLFRATCLLLYLSAAAHAVVGDTSQVPHRLLAGMLMVESSSYYAADGRIVFVNQKPAGAGALGPFQMCRAAFDEVVWDPETETFDRLRTDTAFAQEMCERKLLQLYQNAAHHRWPDAVKAWHVGSHGLTTRPRAAEKYWVLVHGRTP